MIVTIDPGAGFCFGVDKAIKMAEEMAQKKQNIFCLGEIVHNDQEVKRLNNWGVKFIEGNEVENLKDSKMLIRAHGEPPETYLKAKTNNVEIIDATCPIVLKLQQKIKKAWLEMKKDNGQVAIAGKKTHPEVIGLNGQTDYNAIIIEKAEDIGKIDINHPLWLFAQTTIDTIFYQNIVESISEKMNAEFNFKNSICKHVTNRKPTLIEFCKNNDVVIFVSGKNSSNGKALFELCKSTNKNSHVISSEKEFDKVWIKNAKLVGISGATSTPLWLMEKVKQIVLSSNN